MNILAINVGSSNVKFATFVDGRHESETSGMAAPRGTSGEIDITLRCGGEVQKTTIAAVENLAAATIRFLSEPQSLISQQIKSVDAVGQRVVHGGTRFTTSVRIDASVKAETARLSELAPLHNPLALNSIEAIETHMPGVPQVAVFDTAYFAQLPANANIYALPYEWYSKFGIRRFGFHGISHSYCAQRAAEILAPTGKPLRIVTCHLGSGCSISAIKNGLPVATSMGFTPLDGIVMGTRSGSIDPGIILYLQRHKNITIAEIGDALNHRSGLRGISGVSADYREVERASSQGNPRARLALEIFANSVRNAIGASAVALGGMDALVFTGGIGEHATTLRNTVCEALQCLGVTLDLTKNAAIEGDSNISAAGSAVKVLVIETREELMIARETARVIALPE